MWSRPALWWLMTAKLPWAVSLSATRTQRSLPRELGDRANPCLQQERRYPIQSRCWMTVCPAVAQIHHCSVTSWQALVSGHFPTLAAFGECAAVGVGVTFQGHRDISVAQDLRQFSLE